MLYADNCLAYEASSLNWNGETTAKSLIRLNMVSAFMLSPIMEVSAMRCFWNSPPIVYNPLTKRSKVYMEYTLAI